MQRGYTGADGLSIMPSCATLLPLQEWIDLVACLKSFTPKEDTPIGAIEKSSGPEDPGPLKLPLRTLLGNAPPSDSVILST